MASERDGRSSHETLERSYERLLLELKRAIEIRFLETFLVGDEKKAERTAFYDAQVASSRAADDRQDLIAPLFHHLRRIGLQIELEDLFGLSPFVAHDRI